MEGEVTYFDLDSGKGKPKEKFSNINILKDEIDYLHDRLSRLYLVTEALWEIVKEKEGLEDSALQTIIEKLDARDGKMDGKAGTVPQPCPHCRKPVSPRIGRCFFCGLKLERTSIFQY